MIAFMQNDSKEIVRLDVTNAGEEGEGGGEENLAKLDFGRCN